MTYSFFSIQDNRLNALNPTARSKITDSVTNTTSALTASPKKGCVPMALFSILSATSGNLATITSMSIAAIVLSSVSSKPGSGYCAIILFSCLNVGGGIVTRCMHIFDEIFLGHFS